MHGFIREMVERHGFVERELKFLFSRARREPAILAAIAPPKDAKARSWLAYRARFVTDARIAEGAEFWRRNAAALARAAQRARRARGDHRRHHRRGDACTAARWGPGA